MIQCYLVLLAQIPLREVCNAALITKNAQWGCSLGGLCTRGKLPAPDRDLMIPVLSHQGAGLAQVLLPNSMVMALFAFRAFSYILAVTGIRGITKAADGLCTAPSSIKQHFCTCCQDLKLHTVLFDYFQTLCWP